MQMDILSIEYEQSSPWAWPTAFYSIGPAQQCGHRPVNLTGISRNRDPINTQKHPKLRQFEKLKNPTASIAAVDSLGLICNFRFTKTPVAPM